MKKIGFILVLFIAVTAKASSDNVFSGKQFLEQGSDTLNILISSYGGVYYYTSPLAEGASNFKAILPKDIDLIIQGAQQEAKKKDHSLVIIFKSERSKKAGDIARWHTNYTRGTLTELEKRLIRLTAERNSNKN